MLKYILIWFLFLTISAVGQIPPCENPESKAFDWQIGVWESEDGKQIHEIKKLIDDCIIQEIWKTEGKETAIAVKSFDDGRHHKAGEKKWFYSWTAKGFHQFWEGRKEDGQWRFYRNWFSEGEAVLSRTYWNQVSADKFERIVEQSRDEGKTWKPWVKSPFHKKSNSLSVRNAHASVYDETRKRLILFGGADSERILNETWEFDGQKWSSIKTSSPSPRTFPSMIYDSARQKILLFGGNRVLFGKNDKDYEFLNDFWEFNGQDWQKIDVPSPQGRAEASFVFDRQRQKAVLFGGYTKENGEIKRFADTWEWDGKSWTKVSEGVPSARSGAAIAYDSKRRKVVLFGGGIRSGGGAETWEWNGQDWHQITSAKTEPRYNSTMVYDAAKDKIIRFGGWDGTRRVSETWEFDGQVWQKLAIESPEARNHTVMVYDSNRRKTVLFGGHNGDFVFGDTWEFDGQTWRRVISAEPQKRIENGH